MNAYHAVALKAGYLGGDRPHQESTPSASTTLLKGFLKSVGIDLVDFKLEFGKTV